MDSRNFRVHGLNAHSDTPIAGASLAPTGTPQVTVSFATPARGAGRGSVHLDARPGHALLDVPDVARFVVRGGDSIAVEPYEGGDDGDIAGYLLGSASALLLHQRESSVLHGAAVDTGHGAVALFGDSLLGKSTLAAALVGRGMPLLADDLVVLPRPATPDGPVLVADGSAAVRVWGDNARNLGYDPTELVPVKAGSDKYFIPLDAASAPAPLRLLIELVVDPHGGGYPEELTGRAKYEMISARTYRSQFLSPQGALVWHACRIAQLAGQAKALRISVRRPFDASDPRLANRLVRIIQTTLAPGKPSS